MKYCLAKQVIDAEKQLAVGQLTHAEIADTLRYLREQGYAPAQLQKLTGFKDYTIRHYLRVSKKLIAPVKELLHTNRIKFSMARMLASLPVEKQEDEARKAIMTGISVHRLRGQLAADDRFCDAETKKYFEQLSTVIAEQTGFSAAVTPEKDNKRAGTITFRYTDLSEFDSICSRLNVNLSEL